MLEGRLKTLHPKIHGGILARHDHPDDLAALAAHEIKTFELVVVNCIRSRPRWPAPA